MKIEFIKRNEKNRITNNLEKFKIEEINYLLTKYRDNIYAYSGDLDEKKIKKLRRLNIIQIGSHILSQEGNDYRLSLDSLNLLKPEKRIIEISDKQAKKWLQGKEIKIESDKQGFIILKNDDDLIGCGKLTNNRITNFMPKGRRI